MYSFTHYPKNHLPGADGKFHEVTPEIFKAYKKNKDHEDYQIKRDSSPVRKKGNDTSPDNLPRVASMDRITEAGGEAILPQGSSAEENALDRLTESDVKTFKESLKRARESLNSDEESLIKKIYDEGMSVREYAELTGISRTTLQSRKSRILEKLRDFMISDIEGYSPEMVRDVLQYER